MIRPPGEHSRLPWLSAARGRRSALVVNDPTRHGQQDRIGMMMRDRHLLGLIEQQLAEKHAVLVVYGGSHWATLSAALQERLGRPKIKPFLK
jgi:hypothetical protein